MGNYDETEIRRLPCGCIVWIFNGELAECCEWHWWVIART